MADAEGEAAGRGPADAAPAGRCPYPHGGNGTVPPVLAGHDAAAYAHAHGHGHGGGAHGSGYGHAHGAAYGATAVVVGGASSVSAGGEAGCPHHEDKGEAEHMVGVGVGGGRKRTAILVAAIVAIIVIIAGVARGSEVNPSGWFAGAPLPGAVTFQLSVSGSVDAIPVRCRTAAAAGVGALHVAVTQMEVTPGTWTPLAASVAANTATCPASSTAVLACDSLVVAVVNVPASSLSAAAAAIVAAWGPALLAVNTTAAGAAHPTSFTLPTYSPSPSPSPSYTPSPSPTH